MSFAEFPEAFVWTCDKCGYEAWFKPRISLLASKNSKHVAGASALLKATMIGATLVVDAERLWRKC
jgi:hypothetical protein